MKIEEITINSKEYPEKLRNIYDSPKKLYVLGNKELLHQKGVAIVGARKATQYGKKIAYKFSKELTEKGINIISGLAIGIDTYAHLGAIQDKMLLISDNKEQNKVLLKSANIGKTIAVMGSGFNNIYPKENVELARRIVKSGGCIVTEYQLDTKPEKMNFPQRNRIISGLSDGILVVEAGKTSGALITAEFALEQGKEIFAVPGDITKVQSEGCNELIKDGANIATSSQEILDMIFN